MEASFLCTRFQDVVPGVHSLHLEQYQPGQAEQATRVHSSHPETKPSYQEDQGLFPAWKARLKFPKLDTLEMNTGFIKDPHIQFVMENPIITHLLLKNFQPNCSPAFWDALLGFHNLRTLCIPSMEITKWSTDKFWQLCTRLERLDISAEHRQTLGPIRTEQKFLGIKHFGMKEKAFCNTSTVPFYILFIQRCPGLTSICWYADFNGQTTFFFVSLAMLLKAKTLPYLEHLEVGAREVANKNVALVVQSMPRITTLTLKTSDRACKLDFATHLRPHFTSLRVLVLCQGSLIPSRMVQDILSSCPSLEKLVAPHVDASMVTEGKPWVCVGLKVLNLAIYFDPPSTVSTLQLLVFDQISKLTRLEEWRIKGSSSHPGNIDLRIQYGLGKLSTLRRLRAIISHGTVQRMGDAEVDWILKQWERLEVFKAELNIDETIEEPLRKRMQDHGIGVIRGWV
ncbi:MAG: hypothetical protein J3Q66DRAFT_397732 [Benniella sp.]|nr:MAG: hypothetical protein J3Q66DRAFT_397732 [Benniella sp.]